MVSLKDLQGEAVWRSERVPQGIAALRNDLLEFFQWPDWRIGTIGDEHHLKGYHRSRDWIQQSRYCSDRSYSVNESEGNRHGGKGYHIAGMDLVTNEVHARGIVARLQTAKATGAIRSLREIKLESGPWHVHLGFDRETSNANHHDLFMLISNQTERDERMVTVTITMPELREGSEGAEVVTLQTLCTRHGIETKADGEFGPKTTTSVKALQSGFGAEHVDGIVGPETWCIALAGSDQL